MWVGSDPSGILQVYITHMKEFTTLTLHVFLKISMTI